MISKGYDYVHSKSDRMRSMTLVKTSALLALSILAGVLVFFRGEYICSTLNIEATSTLKGTGEVVAGQAGTQVSRQSFRINEYPGDEGLKKLYVIELPTELIDSVLISPRMPKGQWGVDRIILSNDTLRYIWDGQGRCFRQLRVPGYNLPMPCDASGPLVSTADDGTISITALPVTGFARPMDQRVGLAALVAFALFVSGVWLLRSCEKISRETLLRMIAPRVAWLVLTWLGAYQLFLIGIYAVDMPLDDEWMYFAHNGLGEHLDLRWLFEAYGEHQIIPTKLLAWLNFWLFGLDFRLQNFVNFFIFVACVAAVAAWKNRMLERNDFQLFPLFLAFMFSAINYENHLYSFQSQFHLALLWSVLMLPFAFRERPDYRSATCFGLLAGLAMFTLSAGVVVSIVYLVCFCLFTAGRMMQGETWREVRGPLLTACVLVAGAGALWLPQYRTTGFHHPVTLPFDLRFWDFFLNVVSLGFGFKVVHVLPGMICLAVVLAPPLMLLARPATRWRASTWSLLAATLGILAVLAAITVGRAWVYPAKTSRFSEFAFMLIPYSAVGWWLLVRDGARRRLILALFFLFCFAAYANDWGRDSYALFRQFKLYDLEWAGQHYSGLPVENYPQSSSPEDLDKARRLGLKFTRPFK